MHIVRGIPQQADHPLALTIGNFDGLHLGHQALLKQLTRKAAALGLPAAVLTFEPHPREYFSPQNAPARLSSLREKLQGLALYGVDRVYLCRFDARFAALSAEDFIQNVLIQGLAVQHLYIGDDFCFGSGRRGNFDMLQAAASATGFTTEAMQTVEINGQRASSSSVRTALAYGSLHDAYTLLGRPYSISGRVIKGDQIGRQLGYPTANIQIKKRRPPLSGVFAVAVEGLSETLVRGVTNVGIRPTVDGKGQHRVEVHLFDWRQNCYGMHLRVHFLHKLRDERKFDSLDSLKTQIQLDSDTAYQWLHNHPDAVDLIRPLL